MTSVLFTPRNEPPQLHRAIAQLEAGGSQECKALWATVGDRKYTVMLSRDPQDSEGRPLSEPVGNDYRWHISVAGPNDVPPWRDFVTIVHALRPGVMFCVPMPPASLWFNHNPNTLHVIETKDECLIESWRAVARFAGNAPS